MMNISSIILIIAILFIAIGFFVQTILFLILGAVSLLLYYFAFAVRPIV